MFTFKCNKKAKTASTTLGVSDKRWKEIVDTAKKKNEETDDVFETITETMKAVKVESNEEAVATVYIVSRMFERNQATARRLEAMKTLLLGR